MAEQTTVSPFSLDSWMKQFGAAMQLAPKTLVQPILPGWTLNVNAFNSASPQTEADVLQRWSYGRQLGRMAEALAALVDAADPKRADRAFDDFREMQEDVLEIKGGDAQRRADRLMADLDVLALADREAHDRLLAQIEQRLAQRRAKLKPAARSPARR